MCMDDFYQRALKKLHKLTPEQCRGLFVSAAGEVNRLETVLDSLHVGIVVCDEKHNLMRANKCAQWLMPLSYSEGALLWPAVGDEKLSDFFRDTLLNNDRVLEKELDVEHLDRVKLLSISVVPLVRNRRVTGSLIFLEDITEKRKGESRLRRAEDRKSVV